MKVFAPFSWTERKQMGIGEVFYNNSTPGEYDADAILAVLLHADGVLDGFAIMHGIHNEVCDAKDFPATMEVLYGCDRCEMESSECGLDPEEGFLADEAVTYGKDDFLAFAQDVLHEA